MKIVVDPLSRDILVIDLIVSAKCHYLQVWGIVGLLPIKGICVSVIRGLISIILWTQSVDFY